MPRCKFVVAVAVPQPIIVHRPAAPSIGDIAAAVHERKPAMRQRVDDLHARRLAQVCRIADDINEILRDEFRRRFRASFAGQLENTVIKRPDGTIEKLSELRKKELE